MAKYIIVAGQANKKLSEKLGQDSTIKVTYAFKDCYSLADEIKSHGVSFLQDIDGILVLDYGFDGAKIKKSFDIVPIEQIKDYAREFVYLQDVLKANHVHNNASKTSLYLAITDSDLYHQLSLEIDGLPGILYMYTEIYLMQLPYKNPVLLEILYGRMHKKGLYHKDIDRQDMKSQNELRKENFIKENKTFQSDILDFDKTPHTLYNAQDYIDSPYNINKRREEKIAQNQEKSKAEKERKKENLNKKKNKNISTEFKDVESEDLEVVINQRSTKTKISSKEKKEIDGIDYKKIPTILDLKKRFEKLANLDIGAVQGKLEKNNGVAGIVSYKSSGGSGLVANFADIFALSNKSVLVVDLDVEQRNQTIYFDNYTKLAKEHYGISNGLIKASQGGSIKENAVEITSRVSLLGIDKDEVYSDNWVYEIAENLDFLLESCRAYYDIVLIDIPEKFFFDYIDAVAKCVDKLIFCTDNNYYKLKNLLSMVISNYYNRNPSVASELYEKTEIILNKYSSNNKDPEGNESNLSSIRELIKLQGYPLDRINIAGALPIFEDWEVQFSQHTRYVWLDEKAMSMYRYILSKLLW